MVSWHFRSHDQGTNDTLGWQIDSIKLVSGAETNNDCNGNGVLDSCDIAEGTSDDCNSNGIPDTCDISEGTSTDCNDNLIPDDCESQQDCNTNGILDICEKLILRVDEAVVGGNEDGSSWENAITDLQTALTLAGSECISVEIWAANGVYEPADIGGDRSESFALQSNVAIYGGFAGNDSAIYSGGETKLKQRDILSNPTILSGDLNGDDVDTTGLEENSYRVVVGNGTTASAILDGVTISAGNANGPDNSGYTDDYDRGAAIYIYSGNPTIRNCMITGNSSEAGAVYMRECDSAISNCDITDNTGDWEWWNVHTGRISCHYNVLHSKQQHIGNLRGCGFCLRWLRAYVHQLRVLEKQYGQQRWSNLRAKQHHERPHGQLYSLRQPGVRTWRRNKSRRQRQINCGQLRAVAKLRQRWNRISVPDPRCVGQRQLSHSV